MAITSGFFNSVNGDRTYDADQMSNYFDGLVSNGVYETIGDRFQVTTANDGMNINVGSGRAIIQSHWVKNDSTAVLTLDPSDVQLNRIDAIVLRLDTSAREISLAIKKGTAVSGTPVMPAISQTDSVYELYIATVYIAKGATQPTSITDLRPSSYCGWVTGIIEQVNTSDLFTQWQAAYQKQFAEFEQYVNEKEAAFNSWFEKLTQKLVVDTTIHEYQSYKTIAYDEQFEVELDDLPAVDENSDVVLVFVNGIYFRTNYKADPWASECLVATTDEGITTAVFTRAKLKKGDEISVILIKSQIGSGSLLSAANGSLVASGTGESVIGNATVVEEV